MPDPSLRELANSLRRAGRHDEAVAAYRQAIAQNPADPDLHILLANCLMEKSAFPQAIVAYRQAIALKPDYAQAHSNLANALTMAGQFNEAIAACKQAIAIKPDSAEALINLGNALRAADRPAEAVVEYRKAISLNPNIPQAHANLGSALKDLNRLDEAIAAYRQALQLNPNDPATHWNFARLLLMAGHFDEGWQEFEWRHRLGAPQLTRDFPQPLWNGQDIPNQTLLVHTESGFGDAIHFIRLLPQVAPRAGKLVLECQPELKRLFAPIPGAHQLIARGDALPPFDYRISLPSLARVLKIRLENIPNSIPYLKPPHEQVEYWKGRVPRDDRKNIGLCWSGSRDDLAQRSRELSLFTPLSQILHVRWFSLQKGPESKQTPPQGMNLIDHTEKLTDFADTAALIDNLDLVISVDTSIAHLAGAIGKPVWVLIPRHSDFRWLTNRTDSPWYPTMKLFRQPAAGKWNQVISQIAGALSSSANLPPG
jgi:tetratricopeptide (TPR) repeat protein